MGNQIDATQKLASATKTQQNATKNFVERAVIFASEPPTATESTVDREGFKHGPGRPTYRWLGHESIMVINF